MRITWFGHAAFGLEGANDAGETVRVVLDPYNYPGCGGYLPVDVEADVVSVSHDNPRYHSDTSAIRGDFLRLEGLDVAERPREVRGVPFTARRVHENDRGEGPNAMVRLRLDGLEVAHLGDLGHALAGDDLEFLRGTDVLLALAGGPPTIALPDLRRAIEELRPPVVVPMHFKTPKVNLDILPLASVLEELGDLPLRRPEASAVELTRDDLPPEPTLLVLEPAR